MSEIQMYLQLQNTCVFGSEVQMYLRLQNTRVFGPKPGQCAAEEVQTSGVEQLEASEQGGEAKMEQTKSLRSGAQALSVYGVPSSSYHA